MSSSQSLPSAGHEVSAPSAAHTPGPWSVVAYGDGDSLVIHSGEDWRVCFMATPGDSYRAMESIEANARLIAAAPDLLAVAEDAAAIGDAVSGAFTDRGGTDRIRLSDGTVLTGEAATALLELCRIVEQVGHAARAAIAAATGNTASQSGPLAERDKSREDQ